MIIRVTKQSRSTAVAGCIANSLRDIQSVEIHAIGAAAVNQAVKAVAIARGYLAVNGIDIVMQPHMETSAELDDKTIVVMRVERKTWQ